MLHHCSRCREENPRIPEIRIFLCKNSKIPWSSSRARSQAHTLPLPPLCCHRATLVPLMLLSPSQPLLSVPAPGWAAQEKWELPSPSHLPVPVWGGCATRATNPWHSCAAPELHRVALRELFPSLSDADFPSPSSGLPGLALASLLPEGAKRLRKRQGPAPGGRDP